MAFPAQGASAANFSTRRTSRSAGRERQDFECRLVVSGPGNLCPAPYVCGHWAQIGRRADPQEPVLPATPRILEYDVGAIGNVSRLPAAAAVCFPGRAGSELGRLVTGAAGDGSASALIATVGPHHASIGPERRRPGAPTATCRGPAGAIPASQLQRRELRARSARRFDLSSGDSNQSCCASGAAETTPHRRSLEHLQCRER
jgi:hypothetical protein